RTLLPGMPLVARAGRALRVRTRVHNLSTRPFPADASYGRRLVRLGAQLCTPEGTLINRDYARAGLPSAIGAGAIAAVPLYFPPVPGRGQHIVTLDVVSEGVDWSERCGSPTTPKKLWVR